MKIVFDFDSTLTEAKIKSLAKAFIAFGNDVWICTSRPEIVPHNHWNNDCVFEIAKELGIPKEKIIFTAYADKAYFLDDFDYLFDDDELEIEMLKDINSKCQGILIKKNDILKNK